QLHPSKLMRRTMLVIDGGQVRAFTRSRFDWTDSYRPIVNAAEKLCCRSAVIDGEVIVQDEDGRSDFEAVRYAIANAPHRLVFFAFDLPLLNGDDLCDAPLEERRDLLRIVLHQSFDGRQRRKARIQ